MVNASGGMFEDHGQDEGDVTHDDLNAGDPESAAKLTAEAQEEQSPDNAFGSERQDAEYGEQEDGQTSEGPTEGGPQAGFEAQTGTDEEEELRMKIVLYYHTLVSEARK